MMEIEVPHNGILELLWGRGVLGLGEDLVYTASQLHEMFRMDGAHLSGGSIPVARSLVQLPPQTAGKELGNPFDASEVLEDRRSVDPGFLLRLVDSSGRFGRLREYSARRNFRECHRMFLVLPRSFPRTQ